MKLSDYIALRINQETDVVFGYQGSSISHVIDSLCKLNINYVQSNHEQASAFNACGYAEKSNRLGVVVACSGPGSTNLLTGIANAYYDSLPVIFIVGQVSTKELRINNCRQNGFQQTNIAEISRFITKYSVEIYNSDSIVEELEKCISIARSDRMGPTLLSVPHDIQSAEINVRSSFSSLARKIDCINSPDYDSISRLISNSRRPLLLIGGGFHNLKETSLVKDFFKYYKIPVVASLRGINNIPECEYLGMVGIYGNREANLCVYKSDLLIVLGSRLDSRQTGGDRQYFAPNARIIHVDCDINEINREIKVDFSINTTCRDFIEKLLDVNNGEFHVYDVWETLIREIKMISSESLAETQFQYSFLDHINKVIGRRSAVVSTDVGQNQMWVAQSFAPGINKYFLTSGGHGSMGYALPAIIGAHFVSSKNDILIAFMGDAGFQMNMQELETLRRLDIKACIVVFNNSSLGLIRDYQNKALSGRLYGSVIGFSNPSFEDLAKAFGMMYMKVDRENYKKVCLDDIKEKRILFEVSVDCNATIQPEIAYKMPIYNQSPFIDLKRIEND